MVVYSNPLLPRKRKRTDQAGFAQISTKCSIPTTSSSSIGIQPVPHCSSCISGNAYCINRGWCTCISHQDSVHTDPIVDVDTDDSDEYNHEPATVLNLLDWFGSADVFNDYTVDEQRLTFFLHQRKLEMFDDYPELPQTNIAQISEFVQRHLEPITDIWDIKQLHTHWRLRPLQICLHELFQALRARRYSSKMLLNVLLNFRKLHKQEQDKPISSLRSYAAPCTLR